MKVIIGSSSSNIKRILLKNKLSDNDYKCIIENTNNYPDTFKTWFENRYLYVQRIDSNKGWGNKYIGNIIENKEVIEKNKTIDTNKVSEIIKYMKIYNTYMVIDSQPLQHEIRGIGRYGTNLINTIIKKTNFNIKLLVNNFLPNKLLPNIYLREGVEIVEVNFDNVEKSDAHERNVYYIKNEYTYEKKLADIINEINPFIFLNISEFDRRKVMINLDLLNKNIQTFSILHDLIPLKNGWLDSVDINWKQNYMKQLDNLKKYKKLLSNSEFTKKDSSDIFSNIVTMSTGVYIENKCYNNEQIQETLKKFNINKKYIFSQTSFGENKSLDVIVNQYKLLPDNIKNNILLVLGCDIPDDFIKKHQIIDQNIIITGYLNEDDLWILHDNAWLFVFPSSYEGFGLPPVESMCHNKPVLVARNTSLIEIMENDKFMFNNKDNSCSFIIYELYNNEKLYNECRDYCFNRKNLFTWDIVLNKMLNSFNKYKISIILILHNNKNWLNYIDNKFKEIEKKYNIEFEYYIYENNSNEEFKSLLLQFMDGKKGKLLSENTNTIVYESIISKERGIHMNNIRNKNKLNHGGLNSNFTILLDADVYFNENVIINYINHLLTNTNTKMISGYPLCRIRIPVEVNIFKSHKLSMLNHYYDTLAFSTEKYNYLNTDNTCLLKECKRCINHRKSKNILIDESELINDGDIVKLKSVFGCFVMLPTEIYNKVEWNMDYDNINCEHYGFNQEIKKYGDIVFDTNIKYIKHKDRGVCLNEKFMKKFDKLAQIQYYYNELDEEEIYYL